MLRRLLQLYVGLGFYGLSTAMFVRADLGADPWNVFHLGVARLLAMDIGTVMILTGAQRAAHLRRGGQCAGDRNVHRRRLWLRPTRRPDDRH